MCQLRDRTQQLTLTSPSASKNFCNAYAKKYTAIKDLPNAAAKGQNLQWKLSVVPSNQREKPSKGTTLLLKTMRHMDANKDHNAMRADL